MDAPVGVMILVDDTHRAAIEEVNAALTAAGLRESRTLRSTGVITGAVDPGRIGALSAIEGVAAVERSRDVQLPPPDSPVQ
jgi:hypothetical protein